MWNLLRFRTQCSELVGCNSEWKNIPVVRDPFMSARTLDSPSLSVCISLSLSLSVCLQQFRPVWFTWIYKASHECQQRRHLQLRLFSSAGLDCRQREGEISCNSHQSPWYPVSTAIEMNAVRGPSCVYIPNKTSSFLQRPVHRLLGSCFFCGALLFCSMWQAFISLSKQQINK